PQPDHMSGYVPGGDPHLNSGIVNRAFYLTAIDLGTFPAAKIWYAALQSLTPTSNFADTAYKCAEMARILAREGTVARRAPQAVPGGGLPRTARAGVAPPPRRSGRAGSRDARAGPGDVTRRAGPQDVAVSGGLAPYGLVQLGPAGPADGHHDDLTRARRRAG